MDALLRRRQMMVAGGSPTPPGPVIEPVFYPYLKFDGVAYIDTDYVLPQDCSIRVTIGNESNKAAQRVLFAGSSASAGDGGIGIIYGGSTSSASRQMLPYYDSKTQLASDKTINFTTTSFGFFMTPFRYGWGTLSYTYTKGSYHSASPLVFGSMSNHSGNPYSGVLRQVRIYGADAKNATKNADFDNYTPIATFKPCTYQGVTGMWYVEEGKFYGNTAGAGTLVALNSL